MTPATLEPLRARIRELLSTGPMKARVAFAVLQAEGWTNGQVRTAKRSEVLVRGVSSGAWWRMIERPRSAPKQPATVARALREVRRAAAPAEQPARRALVCEVCGLPIGKRAPGEPALCHRPLCREKEAA